MNSKAHHLLAATDLTLADVQHIISDALELKNTLQKSELKKLPTLRGKTIVTAFYENSTRTRVSFETAGKWLSADVINVSMGTSSVAKGESLQDTALTLSALGADVLVVRHPVSGAVQQIARWLEADPKRRTSVINAGDGMHEHPTQALLDATTLVEHFGDLTGKRIIIVGDILHSRVARSNVTLLRLLGAEVVFIAPQTLLPAGLEAQPNLIIDDYLDAYLPTADAVIMLRVQAERMNGIFLPSAKEYSIRYGLNENRVKLLPSHAVIMHPGPMLRGQEIGFQVADSAQSKVLDQVTHGVYVRMAVLYRAISGHALNPEASIFSASAHAGKGR